MTNSISGHRGSLDLRIYPFQQPIRVSWNFSEGESEDFSIQISPVSENLSQDILYFDVSVKGGESTMKVSWPNWEDFIGFFPDETQNNDIDLIELLRNII
ncbi:MAG: hypothetical protein RMY29_011990 [Nostoc sp. CreGUA01]|nr:hypothetical protein [Nostoc sp. CreGUA01]